MPMGKIYKTRIKRKYNRKKPVPVAVVAVKKRVPRYRRPFGGFASKMTVTLKYCDNYLITSGSGLFASYEWRANSIYDPDLTGTGHQPMFRDIYAGIYNKYKVLSSKIYITSIPFPNEAHTSVIYLDDETGGPLPAISTIREQNKTSSSAVIMEQGRNNKLKLGFNAYKVFGPSNEFETTATIGTNPANQSIFKYVCQNMNSANATNAQLQVMIVYNVRFSDLKEQAQN